MNTPKINEALNAFKNIDGANYYPQIYIPKFEYEEDMKEEKNYSASSSNIVQEYIVYIYYSGDSEVDSATNTNDSYAGYVLDSSNNLVYWGMVNEEYANNHEVWVISMNEAVGNGGNFCPPVFAKGAYQYCPESLGGCCGGGGGDDPPPPPPNCSGPDCDPLEFPSIASPPHPDMGTHFPVNFKIEYMTVRDKKEHWLAGKCEIAIRAKLHCHNNLEYGAGAPASYQPYKSDQWSNYLGKIIKQFKRKWVNDQTAQLLNYSLQTNWPTQYFLSDPVYFDYVIFERDIWPSTKNEAVRSGRIDNFWPPYGISQNWEQFYRSAQKVGTANGFPYYTGSFVSTNQLPGAYYATGYVNNSAITYNTKGY